MKAYAIKKAGKYMHSDFIDGENFGKLIYASLYRTKKEAIHDMNNDEKVVRITITEEDE